MAGLDDYQFYTRLQDQENPFWEKANPDDFQTSLKQSSTNPVLTMQRPSDLPQRLPGSSRSHQAPGS